MTTGEDQRREISDTLSLLGIPELASRLEIRPEGEKPTPHGGRVAYRFALVDRSGTVEPKDDPPEELVSFVKGVGAERLLDMPSATHLHRDGIVISTSETADGGQPRAKLIYVNKAQLLFAAERVCPGCRLSSAEYLLLRQLLSGLSLRQAAQADELAYETKRAQFKSLASKLQLSSQSDLIRAFLSVLIGDFAEGVSGQRADDHGSLGDAVDYLGFYYPGLFRVHELHAGADRTLRVADCGPVDGTPHVWVHSQTLPHPGQFDRGWFEQEGIRLFMPLRQGFLDRATELPPPEDHLDGCAADLHETISLLAGGKAVVIANSTGVFYALELARRHPECVRRLTLVASAGFGAYEVDAVDRFVTGIKRLIGSGDMMVNALMTLYVRQMSQRRGLWRIIETAYQKSSRDLEIFTAILDEGGHRWMYDNYRLSRMSVARDVQLSSFPVWRDAGRIEVPVLFLHGADDPVNSCAHARAKAGEFPDAEFVALDGEGQSLFLNRFRDLFVARAAAE